MIFDDPGKGGSGWAGNQLSSSSSQGDGGEAGG